MAHAVHPNYASKHEKAHAPRMNAGVVIKTNSNQRYTTNSFTGMIIREIGRKSGARLQEFVVRNDCPCGSTIGPIIAEKTGIRSVDAGMPQLSMHSCREMMGGEPQLKYNFDFITNSNPLFVRRSGGFDNLPRFVQWFLGALSRD